MSITKHFSFEGKTLTTQTDESGLDWFMGKQVAAALGYSDTDQAVRDHVDDDDQSKRRVIDNRGRNQVANFVNESGLYSLILRSNKNVAKTDLRAPSLLKKSTKLAQIHRKLARNLH